MSLKFRLGLIVVIPLLFVTFYSGIRLKDSASSSQEATNVVSVIGKTAILGELVHELQKERGMSAGHVGSSGRAFQSDLIAQRENVDQRILDYKAIRDSLEQIAPQHAARVDKRLGELEAMRKEISALDTTVPKLAGFYTGLIGDLIGSVKTGLNGIEKVEIVNRGIAYLAIMDAKEAAGLERAMGANGFGAGKFPQPIYRRFSDLGAAQDRLITTAQSHASADDIVAIDTVVGADAHARVKATRMIVHGSFYGGDLGGITGPEWFGQSTAWIDDLKMIEDRLGGTLTDNAVKHVGVANARILFDLGLVGFIFLVSLGLPCVIGRALQREMSRIIGAMQKVENQELDLHIPYKDRSDEIGRIATTLDSFRRSLLIAKQKQDKEQEIAAFHAAQSSKIEAITRTQAYIEFELDGTICDANELFLTATGFSKDEIVGRHHRMFIDPAYASTVEYRTFWARLGRGETVADRFQRFGKNNREIWIDASYHPILDTDGKPVKAFKVAVDVTDQELENRRREEAEDVRKREEDARKHEAAKKQAEQTRVVNSLADGLRNLAHGKLNMSIEAPFSGEYDQLRVDFNEAVDHLKQAMEAVLQTANAVKMGSSEITTAAVDLSKRTEHQAATLEETVAALDQVTATVNSTAEGALRANEAVRQTRDSAEVSGAVVRDAVAAMGEIEKSSDQISQIISMIDEISFQTNLLALNAGVEAARAGDAGRGFAVVASEVRALAQRSSDAAREIKALISTSSEHVETGVGLVGRAGDALHNIADKVIEISELVSNISTSTRQQATALKEVNMAMSQVDQVTQQNAAMVEESTAASHTLSQEAQELLQLMHSFDLAQSSRSSAFDNTPQKEHIAKFATN